MGVILWGECPKCGYHSDALYTGGGLQDCEPQTALIEAGNNEELAAALEENAWFRINRKLAICPQCHKLIAASIVTYQKEDGTEQMIQSVCPNCSGPLMWPAPDVENIPCPVCKHPMKLIPGGHWD